MKRKYEERIEMLTNDIVTLVEEEESAFAMAVKMKWRLRLDTERAIWAGGYSTPTRQQDILGKEIKTTIYGG